MAGFFALVSSVSWTTKWTTLQNDVFPRLPLPTITGSALGLDVRLALFYRSHCVLPTVGISPCGMFSLVFRGFRLRASEEDPVHFHSDTSLKFLDPTVCLA